MIVGLYSLKILSSNTVPIYETRYVAFVLKHWVKGNIPQYRVAFLASVGHNYIIKYDASDQQDVLHLLYKTVM